MKFVQILFFVRQNKDSGVISTGVQISCMHPAWFFITRVLQMLHVFSIKRSVEMFPGTNAKPGFARLVTEVEIWLSLVNFHNFFTSGETLAKHYSLKGTKVFSYFCLFLVLQEKKALCSLMVSHQPAAVTQVRSCATHQPLLSPLSQKSPGCSLLCWTHSKLTGCLFFQSRLADTSCGDLCPNCLNQDSES